MTAYQVLPDLSAEDFAALRADIAARGVLVPVEYDENGNILDGHHRVRACEELGLTDWPRFIRKGLSEADKRVHARQLNLARRHLSRDQKRDLIAAQLRETPEKSNRQVAEGLGVSHPTVANVRREMEATGDVVKVTTTTDTLGRSQPARKPIRTTFVDPDAEAAEPGLVARALDDMLERGEEPTKAALKREVAGNYRAVTTGDNEWYTPREYVDLARAVMGGIDLDPASCAEANATVGASAYFTKDDDGLTRHWSGRVWLNPPYSRALMPAFCEKLAGHVDAGDVSQAILVSHNNTETAWFHRLHASCSAICFPSRRIRFYAGDDVAAPVNGQVFFYFGGNAAAFIAAFRHIGILMVPA